MADMQGGREGPPRFVNASICDKIGSQFAVHATIAALFSRERTGEGQLVEVPMLESLVGFNLVEHQAGQSFEPALGPAGYERSMVEYRRPYETADGLRLRAALQQQAVRAFFTAMGRPEMLDDPRVTEPKTRSEKIGELYEMVAECVGGWRTAELLAALEEADIPNGRATPMGELADDLHLKAVGLFQHFDHPSEGRIRLAGRASASRRPGRNPHAARRPRRAQRRGPARGRPRRRRDRGDAGGGRDPRWLPRYGPRRRGIAPGLGTTGPSPRYPRPWTSR